MKIYVDSANLKDIKLAYEMGLCDGVTTNPSLIAKEGKPFQQTIAAICDVIDGDVHAEVLSLDYESIVEEGRELMKISPQVVVKIPMMHDGLRAVHTLANEGIRTNVTLIFSTCQAILSAKAGAYNISPFVGRLDDISTDGIQLVSEIAQVFEAHPDIETDIIVASIRHPLHVVQASLTGAEILTIPGNVLLQMEKHPLTDSGIAKFVEDSKKFVTA